MLQREIGEDHCLLPPASGAWREGDPVGKRKFLSVGALGLESGSYLPDVTIAYETWGTLSPQRDNALLVLHALTGDSHIRGDAIPGHPTSGWWTDLIGSGAPIDTDKYYVVAPNVLGGCQGTTGPASRAPDGKPWGPRFPFLTIRDSVTAEAKLADALGITRWRLVLGGSFGGMRALEWAVMYPHRVEKLVAVATTAQTSADQIAWAHTQLAAIDADPAFNEGNYYDAGPGKGPHKGLSVARQIAQTTYRSAEEFGERFGQAPQGNENPWEGGRYAVQSYLEYQGDKLIRRFDANSYKVLTEAFMSHNLGRGRGRVEDALAEITAHTLVVAVDSDRLCLPSESERIAEGVPHCAGVELVRSRSGHDGFLLEFNQFGPLLSNFLSV
ncbi:homoserine O-acetyltransferase MetX [Scrofimicrobium canadense]